MTKTIEELEEIIDKLEKKQELLIEKLKILRNDNTEIKEILLIKFGDINLNSTNNQELKKLDELENKNNVIYKKINLGKEDNSKSDKSAYKLLFISKTYNLNKKSDYLEHLAVNYLLSNNNSNKSYDSIMKELNLSKNETEVLINNLRDTGIITMDDNSCRIKFLIE